MQRNAISPLFSDDEAKQVYIGQGKFKEDDPKKYPAKEDKGLFTGVTGGWAGGEESLQVFINKTKEVGRGEGARIERERKRGKEKKSNERTNSRLAYVCYLNT